MQLVLPRGAIQVNQFHDELLAAFPAWRGTSQPDGSWADPALFVEYTKTEIRVTVPPATDPEVIARLAKAHVPGLTPTEKDRARRLALRTKLQTRLQLTEDELNLLLKGG